MVATLRRVPTPGVLHVEPMPNSEVRAEHDADFRNLVLYWGRERPPWLGDPHTPKCLAYFGWVWEPHDAVDVTEAKSMPMVWLWTISRWAVGGHWPWHEVCTRCFSSRVSEHRKQDAAVSIEIMLEIQQLFKDEWQATQDDPPTVRRLIADPVVFFIVGFCGSMHSFELTKMMLMDLRNQIHLKPDPDQPGLVPHLGWPLRG